MAMRIFCSTSNYTTATASSRSSSSGSTVAQTSPAYANVPRNLQNAIFVDDNNDNGDAPVCIERTPFVEWDDPSNNSFIQFIEPLTMECSEVGERAMATFSYRLRVEPDTNDFINTVVSVAVSHDNEDCPVSGITMGRTNFPIMWVHSKTA